MGVINIGSGMFGSSVVGKIFIFGLRTRRPHTLWGETWGINITEDLDCQAGC